MEMETLFWSHIPGSVRYLQDFETKVGKHRVLFVEEVPFLEVFLQQVIERLRQWDSGLQIESLKASRKEGEEKLEEWLMNRYAPYAEYHPMDGTRTQVIARNHLLEGKVLLVQGVEDAPEWISFAVEYAKHSSAQNGLLLLLYQGENPLTGARKGVAALKWEGYLTSYDMQLYASYCVSAKSELPSALRHYITEIAARLAGLDPVFCSELVSDDLATDAVACVKRLASRCEKAERLIREGQTLHNKLWEAQIQLVFPIIERTRQRLIGRYAEQLKPILPQRDDFDRVLQEPQEMELRHLWYYYFKANGFSKPEDKSVFQRVYDARNDLAHLNLLDSETVRTILMLED